MPPKAKATVPPSDLVPVGRRDLFSKTNPARQHGKRDENGQRPTTSKALILRNGKYGSQGTGELIHMGRMSGREKFDLLAENLVDESKKAILSPLRMEKCLKMAESQSEVYLADITNLRDPDIFRHVIEAELQARTEPTRTDPRRNPSHVAKTVSTRIHNSYMLASAWKIVSDMLNGLAIDGLTDKNVKSKLKNNPDMRERYLVLGDMVDILVKMNQDRFALLATTAPHYAKYFKLKPSENSDPTEPEYIFDWTDLRGAADSFLDSIIIELCFPQGTYPKAILYRILHDAVDESPREARRFPQALWDAVGDLAISVELQDLLEAPLFGTEGQTWKQQPRQMPEEYESWIDAQIYSEKASNMFSTFKDTIFPMEKTRHKTVLDSMWKQINKNYISVSGLDINSLWNLEDAFDYEPQWTSFSILNPNIKSKDRDTKNADANKDSKQAKLLAITSGGEYDSDGSMPGLQSVSNSEDEDDEEGSETTDDEYDDGESDGESGYDTEDEDDYRDMLREAMDAAHEANWFDAENIPKEFDPFTAEDRKGNPFLKLLGSLRGRMFSASPKLKTATRTEPRSTARGAFRAMPTGVPKAMPTTKPSKPEPVSPSTTTTTTPTTSTTRPVPPPKSQKATVEEVEDEDDHRATAQKKKKKKKSKKKKKGTSPEMPPLSPSMSVQPTDSTTTTASKATDGRSPQPSMSSAATYTPSFMASSASLALGDTATAQSAHSYLQQEHLMKPEKKVKSRPDHASLFSNTVDEKNASIPKVASTNGKEKETQMQDAKKTWFSKLGKKANGLMHQLLRPGEIKRGPMKWESFLRVMREMGFEYDPSTAGSSVRFDPPSKKDRPITFHKPHPDPTLQHNKLREFAKRLKKQYGWSEQDLMKLDGNR